jgi:hypothetical protein
MGGLFLTDQRVRADETYRQLATLLPGKVAIWTADHDAKSRAKPEKVLKPAAHFSVDELEGYPVVVVTHEFFKGKRGRKARQFGGRPRALTFVDERPNEVRAFDVQMSQAEQVLEHVQVDDANRETIAPHVSQLIGFMRDRTNHSRDLEKPTDDAQAWSVSDDLWWFRTVEADRYAKQATNAVPAISQVFGFARCVAEGYAFITRSHGGKAGTRFIGYRSDLLLDHGMVLLDATADIDGVQQICPWRVLQPTPRARYDNLEIVHVPPFTRERLSKFFVTLKNRTAYAQWMRAVILDHMKPGQRALVVCKKALFDNENVPNDLGGTASADPVYVSIEGRAVALTHWGQGIGANNWKDADVVFLFDEFHQPRRLSIGDAQALRGHKATEGDLATMSTQNSRAPAVDMLEEGRLLRWSKQMCLRGRARCFDEHGLCGKQKLVCTGDRQRLLAHVKTLYPGAKVMLAKAANGCKLSRAEALLLLLSNADLPDEVSTTWVGQQLGRPWREITDAMTKSTRAALEALGWRYIPQRGRGRRGGAGSRFDRIASRMTTAQVS